MNHNGLGGKCSARKILHLHKLLNMASGNNIYISAKTIAGLSDIPRLKDNSLDGDREYSEVHTKLSSCLGELPQKFAYCALEGRGASLAVSKEKGNGNKEKESRI